MDTLDKIKCPACGKEMEKVFIPSQGINIDICTDGCGGIFFDNREFEAFNEEHEDISLIKEKLDGKIFDKVDTNAQRMCPACGAKMVKNSASVGSKIIVDDCYICGGKFLDNEELYLIRKEYKNDAERTSAAIGYLFNNVGDELSKIDAQTAKRKISQSMGQKIFYSLFDIK